MLGKNFFTRAHELDTGQEALAVRVISAPYIGNFADTVQGAGTATSPGAQSAIAKITPVNLPAGVYYVTFGFIWSGTQDVAAQNNMTLYKAPNGGVFVTVMTVPTGEVTTGIYITAVVPRVTLDGGTGLTLAPNTNTTTGAVYTGGIQATRIQ